MRVVWHACTSLQKLLFSRFPVTIPHMRACVEVIYDCQVSPSTCSSILSDRKSLLSQGKRSYRSRTFVACSLLTLRTLIETVSHFYNFQKLFLKNFQNHSKSLILSHFLHQKNFQKSLDLGLICLKYLKNVRKQLFSAILK